MRGLLCQCMSMGFWPILSSANTIKKKILFMARLCVRSQHPFAHLSTNRSLWESTGSIKALKWAAGGQCTGVIFSKLGWINTSNQQWEQWNRTALRFRKNSRLLLPGKMTIVKSSSSIRELVTRWCL